MNLTPALVLDANILIHAVLGKRVRSLIETYAEHVRFFRDDSIFTGFWYGFRGACIVACWPQHARQEAKARCGPGAYRPDPTAGMTAMAAWPPPEIVPDSRPDERPAGPRCTHQAAREKQATRRRHD